MIDFGLIANGIAIGMAVAAPIGPVNLIVIRRTLHFGWLNGFLSGGGAATGDAIFAIIAGFGLTAAIDLVVRFEIYLQLAGGLFLVLMGLRTFFTHPHLEAQETDKPATAQAKVFGTTFALTITNPATMLGFIAIFGGIAGLTSKGEDYGHAATVVASVMAGSVLWWCCVSGFVAYFRKRMNDSLLEKVNHVSGALITIFGLVVLGRLVFKLFGLV
ncbi:threonine/homoserine/homoserine lactone efflux protein [Parvibaculum indicum]|uniref:LysE family translocator n=1 Tax=Parvibaculum indicum TaxID=562969 RepID=UPI00141EC02C|nr:LysE family transporter [Parvibaculum indicum]NIJ42617.1 threonine/homoserine/homoserine lactone efflux protein [Parvibaculum indicum]